MSHVCRPAGFLQLCEALCWGVLTGLLNPVHQAVWKVKPAVSQEKLCRLDGFIESDVDILAL